MGVSPPYTVVKKRSSEVVLIVSWRWIFVSGAFGSGNDSSTTCAEGPKAAPPASCITGIEVSWDGGVVDVHKDKSLIKAVWDGICQGSYGISRSCIFPSCDIGLFKWRSSCLELVTMDDAVENQSDSSKERLEQWGGAGAVNNDPDEQRVLFAALDSF